MSQSCQPCDQLLASSPQAGRLLREAVEVTKKKARELLSTESAQVRCPVTHRSFAASPAFFESSLVTPCGPCSCANLWSARLRKAGPQRKGKSSAGKAFRTQTSWLKTSRGFAVENGSASGHKGMLRRLRTAWTIMTSKSSRRPSASL